MLNRLAQSSEQAQCIPCVVKEVVLLLVITHKLLQCVEARTIKIHLGLHNLELRKVKKCRLAKPEFFERRLKLLVEFPDIRGTYLKLLLLRTLGEDTVKTFPVEGNMILLLGEGKERLDVILAVCVSIGSGFGYVGDQLFVHLLVRLSQGLRADELGGPEHIARRDGLNGSHC